LRDNRLITDDEEFMIEIPATFDGLTAEWMTEVYAARYRGVAVESVEIGNKVFGSSAKAHLALSFNQAGIDAGLSSSVIVKTGFTEFARDEFHILDRWDDLISMLNLSEARFYDEFSDMFDVNVPKCYVALAGQGPRNTVIVLEDLAVGGNSFGSYDRPLDADAMASAVSQLARIHATKWNSPDLPGYRLHDAFIEGGIASAMISPENWEEQLARPRGTGVPPEVLDRDLCARGLEAVIRLKAESPSCLLHGDPHIGNMYFTPDGQPGFLDWQLFCSGKWAWDLGYSMAGAMEIEDRRTHEKDLVKHYLETLRALGVAAPSFDEAWLDYRRFAAWGILALLTPGGDFATEGYNTVVGQRQATAIVDLESHAALGLK
jgi:fructosamine-3-kinase